MFFFLIQILLALVAGFFLLLVIVEVRSTYGSKSSSMNEVVPLSDENLPVVSVLLPVYNEKWVAKKLIDAVCALDYPFQNLEILFLDDSTDETSKIAAIHIQKYQAKGVPIRYIRRKHRIGYKAGNLKFGLELAKGDFIAIFDSRIIPLKQN